MGRFRVWAPAAARLEVETRGARHAMTPESGGWWTADVAGAEPGTDYAFVVDGEGPFPDPRSRWQPAGVDGPSRLLDPAAFRWADAGWRAGPLAAAVVYELHVGTFTPGGTFDAALARLGHLRDLGVTHVEVMPVNAFPGRHGWGYDGVGLWAVHEPYGGPAGLARFVDACHAEGLAVLLDVVYNHLGPLGNHLARFGPYFTDRYTTPWGPAVNLDGAGSGEVRRFLVENACAWLRDYHLDGLRLDAVQAFHDRSAVHFLEELAVAVAALKVDLGRPLVLVAESDLNDPRLVRSREAGGYGLHAQWSDDFHHALHAVLTGERDGYYADFGRLADLATALERAYVYDGRQSAFRGRPHGRPTTGLSGHRFLGYLQNHDQIGNRARGERSAALLSPARLRVAAALVLTAPFVPLLFQGEEWGASSPFLYFTDHPDAELAGAVREGRRREFAAFGWDPDDVPDPQAEETFLHSRLDWSEPAREPHASLLDWHRRLITLRRALPALHDGRLEATRVRFDEEARWLAVARGPVTVAANLGETATQVELPGAPRLLLASDPAVALGPGGLRLPPDTVGLVRDAQHAG